MRAKLHQNNKIENILKWPALALFLCFQRCNDLPHAYC